VERYVLLLLLRGGEGEGAAGMAMGTPKARGLRRSRRPRPTPAQKRSFAELRGAALASGLTVQPPESPYLGEDELRLLCWLAQAQRIEGLGLAGPRQPALLAAVIECEQSLDMLGLRLSPLTLYGGRESGVVRPAGSASRFDEN